MSGTSNLHNYQIIIDRLFQYLVCHHLSPPSPLLLWTSIILKLPTLILQGWILRGCAKAPFPGPSTASSTTFTSLPLFFCQFLQAWYVFDLRKSCKNINIFSVSHSLNVTDFTRYAPLWFSAPHGYHRLTLISLVRYRLFFPDNPVQPNLYYISSSLDDQTFASDLKLSRYSHGLLLIHVHVRFNSKLIEEKPHWRPFLQTKSLRYIGYLKKNKCHNQIGGQNEQLPCFWCSDTARMRVGVSTWAGRRRWRWRRGCRWIGRGPSR